MIKQFTFNHFGVNCYVVYDDDSKECAIVDPGMEALYEDAQLFQFVSSKGLSPKYLMLTHAHIDHICGLRQCCERYGLPVTMHVDGKKLLRQAELYGGLMGFNTGRMDDLEVSSADDGTMLHVGAIDIECRYVPGHCEGSLCFVVSRDVKTGDSKAVISGDALFAGSIGRTDLPGGNYQLLMQKIKERLMSLDDACRLLPGHGEHSTIGDERKNNPFLV